MAEFPIPGFYIAYPVQTTVLFVKWPSRPTDATHFFHITYS